ncbi:MAG TPA: hypothetical protein PLI34_12895, partial [Saprospiraceae bacterium]|nr:hypothetical protein [Saprospiraceae bacterium]HRK82581.1 hypothetical protein [Saprospiraceae bacterium]
VPIAADWSSSMPIRGTHNTGRKPFQLTACIWHNKTSASVFTLHLVARGSWLAAFERSQHTCYLCQATFFER